MRCLVLGAGGPVGTALLYFFKQLGWSAVVVDPTRPRHRKVHARLLDGTIEHWHERKILATDLPELLAPGGFDAVLDLTPTVDKRLSVEICDGLGLSLVNGTMVDCKDDIHIAAYNFLEKRPRVSRRPHILASGMNPGAVNAMAEEIIAENEVPDAVIFWEYDDTQPARGGFPGPCTTWCPGESGPELDEDWNFEVLEEGAVLLHEDALGDEPRNFRDLGIPFDRLPIPPDGDAFLVGHEECIYLGWRHDTAVKFIYGFHADNMRLIRAAGYGVPPTLLTNTPGFTPGVGAGGGGVLRGQDIMGVSCRYDEDNLWIGQYCQLENTPDTPVDSNATCVLVAAGMAASVLVLQERQLPPGAHLTHEVPGWLTAFRTVAQTHAFESNINELVAK